MSEVVRIGKFAENALDSSSKIKQKIIDKLATLNGPESWLTA